MRAANSGTLRRGSGLFRSGGYRGIPAGCNLLALAEKADAARLPKLYMACGEQDALYAANVQLADKLTALGADIRFEHWTGIHNWEFWDAAVRKALDHLL